MQCSEDLPNCFPEQLCHGTFPWVGCEDPSHPSQHLLLSLFLITAILLSVDWSLPVVPICVLLMADDTEHLSMCLLFLCLLNVWKFLTQKFLSTPCKLNLDMEADAIWSLLTLNWVSVEKQKNALNIFSNTYLGQNGTEHKARAMANQR